MSVAHLEHIAAGGNRHPSAADWDSNILAYGTGNNIAIWDPQSSENRGVKSLLSGHTDTVNSVKLFKDNFSGRTIIVSGSADKTVRIWLEGAGSSNSFVQVTCLSEHAGSVNTIAVLPEVGLLVTGAADATIKTWQLKTVKVGVSIVSSLRNHI